MADLNAINAQLAHDPQWQALVRAYNTAGSGAQRIDPNMGKGLNLGNAIQPYVAYLKSKGITLGSGDTVNPQTGQIQHSFIDTPWGTVALVGGETAGALGAAYAVPALAGAAATPATAAPAAGAGDATTAAGIDATAVGSGGGTTGAFDAAGNWVADSGYGPAAGAAGGAGSAGAGSAGTFSAFTHALTSPTVIGAGVGLVGAAIQAYEAGKATAAQTALAQQALALQAQQFNQNTALNVGQANQKSQAYNTTLANLSPFRAIGQAAASKGGWYLGLPGYETGNTTVLNAPPPSQPVKPLTVPPPIQVPGMPAPPATPATWQPVNTAPQQQPAHPQPGQQGVVNGQAAVWDGQGWLPANQSQSSVGA